MAIINIQRRLAETGRIRIGQQVPSGDKKRPAKLETFRLTSGSEKSLRAVAAKYVGQVHKWEEGPTSNQWDLFTTSSTLDVLIPPEAMSFSQFYELWSGGGCQRRCDGEFQVPSEEPCVCDPENRECKPHTRLSVMLADLPGAGLWRLDTQGWNAATELGGAFELADLIAKGSGRAIVPGVLRLDQREVKRPDPRDSAKTVTRKFAVPVIDFDVNMSAIARGNLVPVGGVTPVPELEQARSFGDELQAIDTPKEKPRRANSAEPVRSTGIRPHARGVAPEDDEGGPNVPPELLDEVKTAFGMLNEDETAEASRIFGDVKLPTKMSEWNTSQLRKALAIIKGVRHVEDEEPTEVPTGAPLVHADQITAPKAPRNKVTQLNIRFDEAGFGDREVIHSFCAKVLGLDAVASLNDLTTAQVNHVLQQLEADTAGV